MPFTPLHMGPGILVKSLMMGGFSLMVFGWTQIIMDIQPLIAIITKHGKLHGFSHTYLGATIIAVICAVTGKLLSQIALSIIFNNNLKSVIISWKVSIVSAFIGSYSHIIINH